MIDKESILLVDMFSGNYAEDHIAHEIVNLFQTDDGKRFIYVPHNGEPTEHCEQVKKILMLRYLGDGKYEVLGRARAEKCLSTEEDQQYALEHMSYGGRPFKSIMRTAGQEFKQNEYITFEAYETQRLMKPLIIQCVPRCEAGVFEGKVSRGPRCESGLKVKTNFDGSYQSIEIATGLRSDGALNLLVPHQRRFIENDNELYTKLSKLFDKRADSLSWIDVSTIDDYCLLPPSEDSSVKDARFLSLLNIEESELAYSNLLAHFLDENLDIAKEFLTLLMERVDVEPNPQDLIPLNIEREKHHVDILIETYDKVFIVENKIHAGLSKGRSEEGDESQLDKYVDAISEIYANKDCFVIVLCPDYNNIAKEPILLDGKIVPLISYKEVFDLFSGFNKVRGGKRENQYFQDFMAILSWQLTDHLKDTSRRYFDLSSKRFQRAIAVDEALNSGSTHKPSDA